MKFCMITTFFGPHSFGGDAAYVERLAQALCRRGHEVHVFYCVDAFNAVKGNHPLRSYEPAPGLKLHPLKSPLGVLSPLATQATGLPLLKSKALREVMDADDTDVIHFHNISLVGGPGVLNLGSNRRAARIMSAHEHWLICPTHLIWNNGRRHCDSPTCIRCQLAAKRPPQMWRFTSAIEKGLRALDALIFPSRHSLEEHARRGIGESAPLVHLPYFLPDDWSEGIEDQEPEPRDRPYLATAGRLVEMKGFHRLIPLMRYLPEVDLRIAGTGPHEPHLRKLAAGLPNVHFEGLISGRQLAGLFRGSRAVVVPSLFYETFGYVVLEAFATGTPVIVHEGGGAIRETGVESGGGLGYKTDDELLTAMRRLVHDDQLRAELAATGFAQRIGPWSESEHVHRYLEIIDQHRQARDAKSARRADPSSENQPAKSADRTASRSRIGA